LLSTNFNQMKKLTNSRFTFLLICLAVFTFSCSDDETTPKNQITIGKETFKVSNLFLESHLNLEEGEETWSEHSVYLTEKGLSVNDNGSPSGTGHAALFTLISESPTELKTGVYELGLADTQIGDVAEFFMIDEIGNFKKQVTALNGKITVSKSGNKYTFKLSFNVYVVETEEDADFGDSKISGNYTGTAQIITGGGDDEGVRMKEKKGKRFNAFRIER
jgi:hypothetical protein